MSIFIPYDYVPTPSRPSKVSSRTKYSSQNSSSVGKSYPYGSKIGRAGNDTLGNSDDDNDQFPTLEELLAPPKQCLTEPSHSRKDEAFAVDRSILQERGDLVDEITIEEDMSLPSDIVNSSQAAPLILLSDDESSDAEPEIDLNGREVTSMALDVSCVPPVVKPPSSIQLSNLDLRHNDPENIVEVAKDEQPRLGPPTRLALSCDTGNVLELTTLAQRTIQDISKSSCNNVPLPSASVDASHDKSTASSNHKVCAKSVLLSDHSVKCRSEILEHEVLQEAEQQISSNNEQQSPLEEEVVEEATQNAGHISDAHHCKGPGPSPSPNPPDSGSRRHIHEDAKLTSTRFSDNDDEIQRSAERRLERLPVSHRDKRKRCWLEAAVRGNNAGSHSESEDELIVFHHGSDNDQKGQHLRKRRRVSLYRLSKPKERSQQGRKQSSKSRPLHHQTPETTLASHAEAQAPFSAASATPGSVLDLSRNCNCVDRLSADEQLVLVEITLRWHSTHCYSFNAIIQGNHTGQGILWVQARRLIESIGIVGQIDDFMIKQLQLHLFLLTGFSRQIRSQSSHNEKSIKLSSSSAQACNNITSMEAGRGKRLDTTAMDYDSSEQPNSDDDSDNGFSSDAGESSGAEPGLCCRVNRKWSDLELERLRAYKKENQDWPSIFRRFPGRTENAVRMRWSIIQKQGLS